MKRLTLAVLLGAIPATLSAQSAPPASAPSASVPTSMGRWDEYQKRQERAERKEKLDDERFGTTKPASVAAGNLVPKQQVINDFAACIWRTAPEKARAALGTAIDTSAERAALKSVAYLDSCSDLPFISGRSGEFRGALAEAGIHADSARAARLAAMAPAVVNRVPVATGRAFVASYSGCVASADPAKSLALLSTPVGSSSETAAIQSLGTALMGCMPEEAQYRIDVRDVRNHIADALYRMSEVSGA